MAFMLHSVLALRVMLIYAAIVIHVDVHTVPKAFALLSGGRYVCG